jgi:electron transport complex protein RnfB
MKQADPVETYNRLKARVAEERLPVDQVYYDLAARLAPDDKEFMPRIIARLANQVEARIVAALPDPDLKPVAGRSLEISEAFASRLNMDKATVEKHIRALFEKGLVFPTKKGPTMARSLYQLHDSALGNPKYDGELGQMYYDLWGAMEGPKLKPSSEDLPEKGSEFRILPRWQSIKDVPGVQPFEDVRAILKSRDLIAIIPCGCKRSHTDRWCGVPEESCLTFDRTAQYNLDKGVGRRVTYDEAVEIAEKFDRLPTVHMTVNQREVGQLLCNCHYCCCIISVRGEMPVPGSIDEGT